MGKPLKDEIEFQPDAIEIKNERMPFWLRHSVFSIFLFFAGVIAWSVVCKVDVIVQAQGKLVTNRQPIRMQPLERSVIKEVNVVIGQHVKKGDILFTFDPTLYQADADRLSNDIELYQAQYDRLEAELNNRNYEIPADANDKQRAEWDSYQTRRAFFDKKIQEFDETINAIVASKRGSQAALQNCKEQLEIYKQLKDEIYDPLSAEDKKVLTKMDRMQLQIARLDVEGSAVQYQGDVLKLSSDEAAKRTEKGAFELEWRKDNSEAFVKVRQQLETARHEHEKARQLVEYVHLKAPCDAVVHQIAAFSLGSAVREAETLITLIPLDDKLEMEAELRPQDIGKVKIGSKVRVKISAFPFQRYGTLDDCVVRDISSDTISREGGGGASAAQGGAVGGSYYRARISITGRLRNLDGELVDGFFRFDQTPGESGGNGSVGEEHGLNGGNGKNGVDSHAAARTVDHPFIPGMEATAEIKTDKRRIIEYLVYPLIKAFDESAREP